MLARLVREIPLGDYLYEPKWDGFRAIVFRDGDEVEVQSRHGRPFARYFPDVVAAVASLSHERFVIDGEIVIIRDGRFDFEQLMLRTHPAASRVASLSASMPATFIAFDLLAQDGEGLMESPFAERRARLERLVPSDARITLTPATHDPEVAVGWLRRYPGGGVDGVVAKDRTAPYEPGRRTMIKVKLERTVDCVVAGVRVFADGGIASLLLGLHDDAGVLRHVGVCTSFAASRRREIAEQLAGRVVPLAGHPWAGGFGLERSPVGRLKGAAGRWQPGMSMDWIPIDPLVAEVAYTALDGHRFRHPASFLRWRPDREPRSCMLDQLA
ncbi:MAG: ATP-dependent DNA ligase [Chloroflexota bacterium]|nr:ATP-dependent DNA ligase [Chloroflexota bacterium]